MPVRVLKTYSAPGAMTRVRAIVVKRLLAGHRYHCQERAHNEYGWGRWSKFSDWFRTPPRPG